MELSTILNETEDIINDFRNELIHKYTLGHTIDHFEELMDFLTMYNNPETDDISNALQRQQAVKTMLNTLKNIYEIVNNKSNNKTDDYNDK